MILFFDKVDALNNIEINNELLSPPFNKNTYIYNYYTDLNSIKINVEKDKDEIVSGYGIFELDDGKNTFDVESNNQVYQINVFKNYKEEKDEYLKKLDIEGYDINFKKDLYEYTIDIDSEEKLNINYEVSNSNMKVIVEGNGNFNNHNNIVLINVLSHDNKKISEYKINVRKTITVSYVEEYNEIKDMSLIEKEIVILFLLTISFVSIILYFKLLF